MNGLYLDTKIDMIRRRIGDEFEYREDNIVYTLQCVERISNSCKGCFFANKQPCGHVAGHCDAMYLGQGKDYTPAMAFVCIRTKNLDDEITKSDLGELTKAIKSIGESFKIVEVFKRLAEQEQKK